MPFFFSLLLMLAIDYLTEASFDEIFLGEEPPSLPESDLLFFLDRLIEHLLKKSLAMRLGCYGPP